MLRRFSRLGPRCARPPRPGLRADLDGRIGSDRAGGAARGAGPAWAELLYIFGMNSVNGGPFVRRTKEDSAESLSDGTANASVQGVFSLEAGKSYVFAAAFASNFNVTVNPGYCHGAVLILTTAS